MGAREWNGDNGKYSQMSILRSEIYPAYESPRLIEPERYLATSYGILSSNGTSWAG